MATYKFQGSNTSQVYAGAQTWTLDMGSLSNAVVETSMTYQLTFAGTCKADLVIGGTTYPFVASSNWGTSAAAWSGSTTVTAACAAAIGSGAAVQLKCTRTSGNTTIPANSTYAFTVTYTVATTACGAPTTTTLSTSVAEADPSLSWSGASSGVNNTITGYEIQYCDSSNGSSWGSWNALSTVSSTATSGSTTVALPTTRGYYRKYRIRTQGTAGSS
jgi:hypothetical protein